MKYQLFLTTKVIHMKLEWVLLVNNLKKISQIEIMKFTVIDNAITKIEIF